MLDFLNDFFVIIFSAIFAIILFLLRKYLVLPVIIMSQMVFLSALITSSLAFFGLYALALVSVYNAIKALATYIASSSSVGCLYKFIGCAGLDGVLSAFFTELFALFILVLTIKLWFIFIWVFNLISDKVWRIGVLIGLM